MVEGVLWLQGLCADLNGEVWYSTNLLCSSCEQPREQVQIQLLIVVVAVIAGWVGGDEDDDGQGRKK